MKSILFYIIGIVVTVLIVLFLGLQLINVIDIYHSANSLEDITSFKLVFILIFILCLKETSLS